MRNWGVQPSAQQLVVVTDALKAFRERWASCRPPFPAEFDGTIADVHALDYMEYEGIAFPPGGIETSGMVCGEVFRRAAGLDWVISYRGDWFVASHEERWPTIAICPVARLHEIECGGGPQFGKHLWFLERAAFECLLLCDPERQPSIGDLIDDGGDYLKRVEKTLEVVR